MCSFLIPKSPGAGCYGVTVPLELAAGELDKIQEGVESLVILVIFTVVR
jgi:hypothetical protein